MICAESPPAGQNLPDSGPSRQRAPWARIRHRLDRRGLGDVGCRGNAWQPTTRTSGKGPAPLGCQAQGAGFFYSATTRSLSPCPGLNERITREEHEKTTPKANGACPPSPSSHCRSVSRTSRCTRNRATPTPATRWPKPRVPRTLALRLVLGIDRCGMRRPQDTWAKRGSVCTQDTKSGPVGFGHLIGGAGNLSGVTGHEGKS